MQASDYFLVAHLVKHVNINLLKGMGTAKLIDLMVYLVINPCLIIVYTIVEKGIINVFFLQPVDHLNEHSK